MKSPQLLTFMYGLCNAPMVFYSVMGITINFRYGIDDDMILFTYGALSIYTWVHATVRGTSTVAFHDYRVNVASPFMRCQ